MNKKIEKHGIVTIVVISIVLCLLLNIFTFVIPFNKEDLNVHYIAYGCAEFVILEVMILIISQLFLNDNSNQKIISLPIIFLGYVTLAIQTFCTFLFYLINAFTHLPIWIVIVVESLLIGFSVIQIAKGFFFKSRNQAYHERLANTQFMDDFKAKLKALYKINQNTNIEKVLSNLLDIALGSDPITNEKTIDSEKELSTLLGELDEAIKNGLEENSRNTIEKIRNVLLERNVLCKTGK